MTYKYAYLCQQSRTLSSPFVLLLLSIRHHPRKLEVIFCVQAVISPLLANLYLHYALDLWVAAWRKKRAHGDMIVVRYADDAVLGFEHRKDAEQFLEELKERLAKFGLELHPQTRLIEFGRYAAERRKRRGEGKPETFNFLGFTHICGRPTGRANSRSTGRRSANAWRPNSKKYGCNCGSECMRGYRGPGSGCSK
jgi:Reverse transcriptase (RNA-dependent DNA polymerase)